MILLLHRCNFERLALVNRKIRALTHTVTHTGKRAYGNNGDKMLRNHSIMSGKAPKASEISAFVAPTTLRNQQVMCSNHTTSSKNTRFRTEIGCFSNSLAVFIVGHGVGQDFDPHRDPYAETSRKAQTVPERKLSPFSGAVFLYCALSDLCHEVSHEKKEESRLFYQSSNNVPTPS